MQMLRTSCSLLLVVVLCSLLSAVIPVVGFDFLPCNCDGIESILQWQKAGDFLIATAYFSIPLEILYFLSCSNIFPFRWVILQFGAFIILCGMTHFLMVFTYEPHSFLVMLSLTIAKILTAIVSFASAITLLTLIPQLLRVKVRENLLMMKANELDREVGLMKKQEATSWHVRMLTQEIRKSLDRHTILYTTLVELSKTLELQNCAVWMPNEDKSEMNLTHELGRHNSSDAYRRAIPINDPIVSEVTDNEGVRILRSNSLLARRSTGVAYNPGAVAAIRMPMLRVSNFKGGTPEMVPACYAILVLVLPGDDGRIWSRHDLEIVEVVADQVAVALSHAAVLEESQLMRDKLTKQNRAFQQARTDALMASEARNSFQRVMSQGMRRPMHTITGLLSMLQQEDLRPEQNLIIDSMMKTSSVLATLIKDIMESPEVGTESLALEMKAFNLHVMIKAAATVAKSLCTCRGFSFDFHVHKGFPDFVVGDEKRIIQVILHMVGSLINGNDGGSAVVFQVYSDSEPQESSDRRVPWKPSLSNEYSIVKFDIGIKRSQDQNNPCTGSSKHVSGRPTSDGIEMASSFTMCKKLVQMMHGNIWVVPNAQGHPESMLLLLRIWFPPLSTIAEHGGSPGQHDRSPSVLIKGLKVLLVEEDAVNKAVTRKLFEKLDCYVCAVSSGADCLSAITGRVGPFDLVVLDINMSRGDAFAVAKKIRKYRSGPWPLIVAMTANMQEDSWERCLQSGMVCLIQKPVTLQAMVNELHRVLRNT